MFALVIQQEGSEVSAGKTASGDTNNPTAEDGAFLNLTSSVCYDEQQILIGKTLWFLPRYI